MSRRPLTPALPTTLALAALAVAVGGCGGVGEPRFAEVSVSAAAPTATLSGSTRALAPAIELSPGCPGYLDPGQPEHVVHLEDATPITLRARSLRGPLAIAVAGQGEVRCDSDEGSGHAPHVTLTEPGDYAVYVASLEAAGDLPYELTIARASAGAAGSPASAGDDRVQVSVTVTSDPQGATVRTPEGQVVGTTPAMFVLTVPRAEIGQERRFVVEMRGRRSAEVSGRLLGGAVVLHATLPAGAGPDPSQAIATPGAPVAGGSQIVVSASSHQPIRDYQVATQTLDVAQDCTIDRASVDVDIRHSFIGDLRVVLRSPRGTEVTLHNHGGGARANLVESWDWSARRGALQALAGQSARGRWTMDVHDDAAADSGTFRTFTLRLSCREGALAQAGGGSTPPDVVAADPGAGAGGTSAGGGGSVGSGGSAGGSGSAAGRTRPPRVPRPRVLDPWSRPQVVPQPQPQPQTGRRNPIPGAGGGGVIVSPF